MLFQLHRDRGALRSLLLSAAFVCSVGSSSVVASPSLAAVGSIITASSPLPERVAARDAWRFAESFIASNPDCDVMVGRGGSMLPLYPDLTVLIVQRLPMSELRAGMTVVFVGDRGRPVAHTLVKKTFRGWMAKGLANSEADTTLVKVPNYLGTVIKAFTPVLGMSAVVPGSDATAHAQ